VSRGRRGSDTDVLYCVYLFRHVSERCFDVYYCLVITLLNDDIMGLADGDDEGFNCTYDNTVMINTVMSSRRFTSIAPQFRVNEKPHLKDEDKSKRTQHPPLPEARARIPPRCQTMLCVQVGPDSALKGGGAFGKEPLI
jgi:hypothetical protein